MSPLERAKEFIRNGQEGEARKVARNYCHLPGLKAQDYWEWGNICEDLALAREALKCYDLALAQEPKNPLYLFSKAQLLYQVGILSQAKRLVTRLLTLYPNHQEGVNLLIDIYQETQERGALEMVKGEKEEKPSPLRHFPPSLGLKEMELFLDLFSGREYKARLYLEPPLGRLQIRYMKGPITPDEARAHILGEIYLAFFPLREDITVTQAVLRIGPPEKEVEAHIREKTWLAEKAHTTQYLSLKAYETALNHDLPCALEMKTSLEYRLWFFFESPIHLLWSKRFLDSFVQKLPYPQMGVTYRPLLPTSPQGIGWKENWLDLPLGTHPSTLKRSLFVNDQGEPYPQQLAFLKTLGKIPTQDMKALCTQMKVGLLDQKYREEEIPIKKLMARCTLIDHLVKKAHMGRILNKREQQALLLTLGKVGDGSLVHRVLMSCPDYNHTKVEKMLKNQPPYPISCYKLREWFPEILPDHLCNCRFPRTASHYPTPILHILPHLTTDTHFYTSIRDASPRRLLGEYLALLEEERRLQERKEILEDELRERLKEQKTIQTKEGKAYMEGQKLIVRRLP